MPSDPNTEELTVRITPETKAMIHRIAEKMNKSDSWVASDVLNGYMRGEREGKS